MSDGISVQGRRIAPNDHHCVGISADCSGLWEPEGVAWLAGVLIRLAIRAVAANGRLGNGNPTLREGSRRVTAGFIDGWRAAAGTVFRKEVGYGSRN